MSIDEATKAAVETVARAKVAEALGGDILGRLIDEVMLHRDRNAYGAAAGQTFFDKIVRECLESTIRQAVKDAIASDAAVKSKIEAAIKEKADAFAATIVDAFAADDWRAEIKVQIDRKDS